MPSDRQIWVRAAVVLAVLGAVTAAALLLRPGAGRKGPDASAPLPSGHHPFPAPGETSRYTLSLNDMAAGELQTSFARAAEDGRQGLEFRYSLAPTGALQYIWHYKLTGSTLMDPRTLRARSGTFTSDSNGKDKVVTVRFEPADDRAQVEVSKPYKDSRKQKQVPVAAPLDVPAALVLLRTADWTPQPATFPVLNGDDLYRWRVSYLRRETIKVPAGEFDADALQVATHEMEVKAGQVPVPKADKEEHTANVWLARDSGMLVCVQAELTLGTFRAELE